MTTWAILVDWDNNQNFAGGEDDITDDVISASWSNGIREPYQHLGPDSVLELEVRNTDRKYDPDNGSSPLAGNLLPHRPVKIEATTASGTVVMWRGWITSIVPEWYPAATQTGKTKAHITCTGTKPVMQNTEVNLPLQENQRTDQIIEKALQGVVLPPAIFGGWLVGIVGFSELGETTLLADTADYSDLDTGVRTITQYGDVRTLEKDEVPRADRQRHQSAYRIIRDMAEAEPGRFFQRRDGKARFVNQNGLLDYVAVTGTVDDSGASGEAPTALAWGLSGNLIINQVTATAYPRESEGSVTLWTLQDNVVVPPGSSVQLAAIFTDGNGRRCGASGTVSSSGLSSTQGTTTVSLDQKADRCTITFTNSGSQDDTVTALSLTGTALKSNDRFVVEREDIDAIAAYGRRPQLNLNLRAIDNYDDAEDIADFEIARRSFALLEVQNVSFVREADNVSNAHLFTWDLGDRIRVIAGNHDATYWLIGEDHRISGGLTVHEATFFLEPHHLVRLTNYAKSNRDGVVNLMDGDSKSRVAQGFQISVNSTVSRVRVYLGRVGDPTGTLTAKLYDSGGTSGWELGTAGSSELGDTTILASGFDEPNNLLATSDTIEADALHEKGMRWVTFLFASPPNLTASTDYWLQVETDAGSDASNYISVGMDSSAPSYSNGFLISYTTHWDAESADAIFEVYQ